LFKFWNLDLDHRVNFFPFLFSFFCASPFTFFHFHSNFFFFFPLLLLSFASCFVVVSLCCFARSSLRCLACFSPPYFECYLVCCFVHCLIASHIALLPHMLLRYLTHCLAWSSPRCLMCLSLPYLTHCFITFSTLPCTLPHYLMCCLFTLMPCLKVPFDTPLPNLWFCCLVTHYLVALLLIGW